MPVGTRATRKARTTRMKRPAMYAGLFFTTLIALSLSACKPDNSAEEALLHIKRSQAYEGQGQYRAAILEARNAVRLDPDNPESFRQLAAVYNTLGYYRSTLKIISEQLAQADLDTLLQKAAAFNALQKYRSSLDLLASHDTGNYSAEQLSQYHLLLGEALLGSGEREAGMEALGKTAGADATEAQLVTAHFAAIEGKVADAQAIVDRLLADDPQNAETLLLAGRIAASSGDYERAEDYLSDALSYQPTTDIMLPQRIANLQLLSRVLTMRGRAPEAMIYNRILAESLPGAVENRSRIDESVRLIREGKLEDAEKLLNTVLEQGDNSRAGTLLGIVNYMQGDVSEASTLLTQNTDPETADPETLEMLISAKLQLRELDQVIAILGPEIESRSADAGLLGLYGVALLAKNDVSGEDYIARSLALKPDNTRLRLTLARFHLQQGKGSQALQELRDAYARTPDDPAVRSLLARTLVAANLQDEAVKLVSKIAADHPNDAQAQTLAGQTLLQSGQREAGVAHLKKAVEINPENALAWMSLAQVALQNRDFANAETYFRRTAELAPASDIPYKGLISAYEAAGETEKGLAEIATFTERDPANGAPLAVLAEFYLLNDKPEQAREQIEAALKRQPQNGYIESVAIRTYEGLARQAIKRGDIDSARRALAVGLSYVPNAVPLLSMLADIEIMQEQNDAALKIAATLEPQAPASALEIRGDVVFRDEPATALKSYNQAWQLQPSPPLAHKIYFILKRTDAADERQAEEFLRQWEAAFPRDPVLLFNLAMIAQANEDLTRAAEHYEELLQVAPTHISGLNNLAWIYYQNKDQKALPLAQRASELAPENAAVLDTYGMILIAQGSTSEGIKMLERASKLAPDSKEIQNHLEEARKL